MIHKTGFWRNVDIQVNRGLIVFLILVFVPVLMK